MERRSFLAVGVASTVGVTVGPFPFSNGGVTTDPEAVVEAYFQRANSLSAGGSDAFTGRVDELAHSASPLPEVAAAGPGLFTRARRRTVAETRVLAENVDPRRFTDDSAFLRSSLGEADASVAENAVVGVQFESAAVRHEWFVATENDEWRLVYFRAVPDSPETVAAAYYRRASRLSAGDPTAFADAVSELTHSVSPLSSLLEDNPGQFADARRATVTDTRVLAANVDPERITGRSGFLRGWLSDADVRRLAGRNAVVATTIDVDGREIVRHWFLAPEDDAWRLVWVVDLPTAGDVVESFYRRGKDADSRSDFADSVASVTHPVSNLTDLVTGDEVGEELFTSARDARLVSTTVVERDLGADGVVNEFFGATDTTLAEFRERTDSTALVETTFRLDGETATQEWAVATDGPVWRLVGF